MKNEDKRNICLVSNDPSIALGQIEFYIIIGDLHAKTTFNVVEKPSVYIVSVPTSATNMLQALTI